jgi:hypothetical protein
VISLSIAKRARHEGACEDGHNDGEAGVPLGDG